MKLHSRGVLARTSVAMAAAAVGVVGMLAAPAAAAVPVGNATVIGPNGNLSSPALNSGGSQTQWELKLPAGSACTKDTANNSYHIFTFVAPTSVDPTTLTYNSAGPVDPGGNAFVQPLSDNNGSPFIATNTVPVTGVVPNPQPQGGSANFSWAFYSVDGSGGTLNTLPTGPYNVGIACADNNGNPDKIWDVLVTFSASTTDPNGETWVASNPTTNVPESPLTIALPLSAVMVLIGGAIVLRRRSHGAPAAA